jgi:TRAP-type C4-dicarboxylate transport system permease small subunit
MLTFLISLAFMLSLVWAGITWAKREERRRMSADELNGIEEVLGSARDHQ